MRIKQFTWLALWPYSLSAVVALLSPELSPFSKCVWTEGMNHPGGDAKSSVQHPNQCHRWAVVVSGDLPTQPFEPPKLSLVAYGFKHQHPKCDIQISSLGALIEKLSRQLGRVQ